MIFIAFAGTGEIILVIVHHREKMVGNRGVASNDCFDTFEHWNELIVAEKLNISLALKRAAATPSPLETKPLAVSDTKKKRKKTRSNSPRPRGMS